MPYAIKKMPKVNKYGVYKRGYKNQASGSRLGTHTTKAKAAAQIGAIQSRERRDGKS